MASGVHQSQYFNMPTIHNDPINSDNPDNLDAYENHFQLYNNMIQHHQSQPRRRASVPINHYYTTSYLQSSNLNTNQIQNEIFPNLWPPDASNKHRLILMQIMLSA